MGLPLLSRFPRALSPLGVSSWLPLFLPFALLLAQLLAIFQFASVPLLLPSRAFPSLLLPFAIYASPLLFSPAQVHFASVFPLACSLLLFSFFPSLLFSHFPPFVFHVFHFP